MPETVSALGTVTPTSTVTVVPQLSGYLTKVGFKESQFVAKGQFLAQIDPRSYEIQLRQYQGQLAKDEAALAQAQSDLARYERLEKQDSIAPQQAADQRFLVRQDQAATQIDQANIANATLNLSYCRIVSPVAGRVGLRLIDPGNYVTASSSTGIVVITVVKPITALFTIPQGDLPDVLANFDAGKTMKVTALNSDNAKSLAVGQLIAVDNQIDTSTGTVRLRASFANDKDTLFPNQFVNIRLLVNTLANVTLVPTSAVQTGVPGTYVYLVKPDKTVAVQKITTGPSNGVETAVLSGLSPGDTVVTDGVDRLSPGARITIAASPSPAPKAATPAPAPRGGGKPQPGPKL